MRLQGRTFKNGGFWIIEVPMLAVTTQGETKKDAFDMIADAIESLVNKYGFKIQVFPGSGDYFEIGSSDFTILASFLLRRRRMIQGLTLKEVAIRLGARSLNTYARYEQGRAVPTIETFDRLMSALSGDEDFVLTESSVSKI
ncbi:MAG: type II toxin-antitoxin system HicB family antitoxin [Acidobacteria bacterium]|nr:type II toxin-antitoxin system HicB family antitoxin [Acidobacteriota bacterium]MCG2815361.1 type II toxin-antitoxin system HicB family antitoxin [Candidatus Aminicenantes bacterium]